MLRSVPKHNFEKLDELGVAIRKTDTAPYFHTGILYRTNSETRLLHLRIDNACDEIPTEEYRWVETGLDDINRQVIAGLCMAVAAKLTVGMFIRYGFRFDGNYFSPSGDFIALSPAGLTCSTFILALFRTFKIELVKVAEWPAANDEDFKSQAATTEMFLHPARRPDELNVKRLMDQWGSPRFSPAQVVGASSQETIPIGLARANQLAQMVLRDMGKR